MRPLETSRQKIDHLEELRHQAREGGGEEAIEKQHGKGKLTARERLDLLLDPGSFQEIDSFMKTGKIRFGEVKEFLGDGVVTGYGTVRGRLVYVFSQDFTVMGGSLGERHAQKIVKTLDMAMRVGAPVIGLNDSGGARIQEGVVSLGGYADIFYRNTLASGVIPQISAILGPCAGGAVYSPALTDFVFMVKGSSYMFLTGPDVIKTVTHEDVTHEDLGGARIHNERSGVAHFMLSDEEGVMEGIKDLLTYLPSNNLEEPPRIDTHDSPERREDRLADIIPDDPNKGYDVKEVIALLTDNGVFFEVQPFYAKNMVVGFARMNGHVVGIVANQPRELAGALDINASDKAARFIRFCDAFNIPILTLEDVPGFLPGTNQEYDGIIRHGAKLVFAYSEATVPKVTVILRKSYGGAYCVMGSKHLSSDANFAWPTAEIAVMGPQGAVKILHRKDLEKAENPDELMRQLVEEYKGQVANPYVAAEYGFIDDVIDPRDTRPKIINALEMLKTKREDRPKKKHGTMPL